MAGYFFESGDGKWGVYVQKFPCQSEATLIRITEWHGSNQSLVKKLMDVLGMRFSITASWKC